MEIHPNQTGADPKLRAVLEHGSAYALFAEKRSIRRIHVLQIDVRFSDFQKTVVPRNFRVVQRNVRAFAAQYHARFAKRVRLALRGPRQNAQHHSRFFRQANSGVGRQQVQVRTRSVCPCKRWER